MNDAYVASQIEFDIKKERHLFTNVLLLLILIGIVVIICLLLLYLPRFWQVWGSLSVGSGIPGVAGSGGPTVNGMPAGGNVVINACCSGTPSTCPTLPPTPTVPPPRTPSVPFIPPPELPPGEPVCGSNGQTYPSSSAAVRTGVTTWTRGECPESPQLPSCRDSDGSSTTTGGIVTYGQDRLIDFCKDATTVIEFVCENNVPKKIYPSCLPGRCDQGKCVEIPPPGPTVPLERTATRNDCTETDNGQDSLVPGTTTLTTTFNDGTRESYDSRDTCIDDTHVREYYCITGGISSTPITCPYRCMSGACTQMSAQAVVSAPQLRNEILRPEILRKVATLK